MESAGNWIDVQTDIYGISQINTCTGLLFFLFHQPLFARSIFDFLRVSSIS